MPACPSPCTCLARFWVTMPLFSSHSHRLSVFCISICHHSTDHFDTSPPHQSAPPPAPSLTTSNFPFTTAYATTVNCRRSPHLPPPSSVALYLPALPVLRSLNVATMASVLLPLSLPDVHIVRPWPPAQLCPSTQAQPCLPSHASPAITFMSRPRTYPVIVTSTRGRSHVCGSKARTGVNIACTRLAFTLSAYSVCPRQVKRPRPVSLLPCQTAPPRQRDLPHQTDPLLL